MSYTKEETEAMVAAYTEALAAGNEDEVIEALALNLKRPKASIVSKLAYEKVYKPKERLTKQGAKPKTKAEIVKEIAEQLEAEGLESLEKAAKQDLLKLQNLLKEFLG